MDEIAGAAARRHLARRIRRIVIPLAVPAAYITTLIVATTVPADAQVLPNARIGFVLLALVTLTLLVIVLVRVSSRLAKAARSAVPVDWRRPRPWVIDGALVVAVFLGILWMTAVIDNGGYDQRCIDGTTMTVVPASDCEDAVTQTGPGNAQPQFIYEWYFGGTGTQIGAPVQGGSLTDPGVSDGGGSGGSSGGDDGGDGGDGGGDGGGGGGE